MENKSSCTGNKFFDKFLETPVARAVTRRLVSVEIERFSDVSGRVLIYGRAKFVSNRCFRGTEKVKGGKHIDKSILICLVKVASPAVFPCVCLETLRKFFVNEPPPEADINLFGFSDGVRKFYRNKPFYVKSGRSLAQGLETEEDGEHLLDISSTTFDCTYRSGGQEIQLSQHMRRRTSRRGRAARAAKPSDAAPPPSPAGDGESPAPPQN